MYFNFDSSLFLSLFSLSSLSLLSLLLSCMLSLSLSLLVVMFYFIPVIAMDRFGMPTEQNGMMLSYIGVISLVMQGVGISFFSRLFQDKSIINGATVVLTATYYLMVRLRFSFIDNKD